MATVKRKKSGGVNLKEYESEAFVQRFDNIRHHLNETLGQDSAITNRALSLTVGHFLQFQEDQLGRNASGPKKFTKLPNALFHDYSESGSLYVILLECYKFKNNQNWRKFEFSSPTKIDQNLELFVKVETALRDAGHLKYPIVYFSADLPASDVKRLAALVTKHGGSVTETESASTHVIKPNLLSAEPEDVEYLRTIEKRERLALVHWWYYPDSYNAWLPVSEVEGEADPVPTRQGPWVVTARFLTDLDVFNEWMNEVDYEYDEEAAKDVNAVRPRRQRGAKVVTNDDDEVMEDIVDENTNDDEPRRPTTRSRGTKRTFSELSASEDDEGDGEDSEGPSRKKSRAASGTARKVYPTVKDLTSPRNSVTPMNMKRVPLSRTKDLSINKPLHISNISNLPEEQYAYVIPSAEEPKPTLSLPPHVGWFDINQIHDNEKKGLPEFFAEDPLTPSKTPEIYKEYRDFMIYAYQQNPAQYLTATACRRNLNGDAAAIIRVHEYLEFLGLINYNVNPDINSYFMGQHQVPLPPQQQMQVLQRQEEHAKRIRSVHNSLALRPNIFHKPESVHCRNCNKDCTRVRYESQRHVNSLPNESNRVVERASYNICPECFAAGKFPEDMFSADFNIVEKSPQEFEEWTAEETLLLLEAAERFGENWDRVAHHVGTKTKEQCIAQFLRLPIEEQFLEDHLSRALSDKSVESHMTVNGGADIPFMSSANPVMSIITFLSQAVQPEVASAAAQAALNSILKSKTGDKMELDNGVKENGVDHSNDKSKLDAPFSENDQDMLKAAAAAALGTAAVKSKLLAEKEEREIHKLVAEVIDAQLKKLELKMKSFEEIEEILKEEQLKVEKAKQQLAAEKAAFEEKKLAAMRAGGALLTGQSATPVTPVTSGPKS
jgi:SWI/SNF related-matrix-associated actin-dependent regulator of chromatin subfamily C